MSRDRYDRYENDDPDGIERERGPDDGRPDRDARLVASARGRTAAPGLFLVLNGLFGLFCAAALSVPMVFQPELPIQLGRDMAAQQPPGPERQKLEQDMDEAENRLNQNRAGAQIEGAVELGILAVANLVAVLAGLSMRGLGSYGLSLTGAGVSLIPVLTGCCCTGSVLGLWALVVLLRPEVKAGFAARRRTAYSPDPY